MLESLLISAILTEIQINKKKHIKTLLSQALLNHFFMFDILDLLLRICLLTLRLTRRPVGRRNAFFFVFFFVLVLSLIYGGLKVSHTMYMMTEHLHCNSHDMFSCFSSLSSLIFFKKNYFPSF